MESASTTTTTTPQQPTPPEGIAVVPTLLEICTNYLAKHLKTLDIHIQQIPLDLVEIVLHTFTVNKVLSLEVLQSFLQRPIPKLDVSGLSSIPFAQLTQTPHWKDLKEIVYQDVSLVAADFFKAVSQCTNLQSLTVSKITDRGVEALISTPNNTLRILKVEGENQPLSDNAVKLLSRHYPNLISLDLGGCHKVSDDSLLELVNCKYLQSLKFAQCSRISSTGVEKLLTHLKFLKDLNLDYCFKINNDTLKAISESTPQLEKLSLRSINTIDDVGVAFLTSLKHIRSLCMSYCHSISDKSVELICNSMTELEALDLTFCRQLTPTNMIEFAKLSNLKTLHTYADISDATMIAISKGCPKLEAVHCGGWNSMTDDSVRVLTENCRDLQVLNLALGAKLTNKSLQYFSTLPRLEFLMVQSHNFDDEGIKMLFSAPRKFKVLSFLHGCDKVTDAGIEILCQNSPHLETLFLFCPNITTKSLISMGRCCRRLTYLDLTSCDLIDFDGIKQFLPIAKLLHTFRLRMMAISDVQIKQLEVLFPKVTVICSPTKR